MILCVTMLLLQLLYLLARLSGWLWSPMAFFIFIIVVDTCAVILLWFTFVANTSVALMMTTYVTKNPAVEDHADL